jgi:hypothetical protein
VTQDVFVTKRPGGEQWNGQAAQEQIDLATWLLRMPSTCWSL